MNNPLYFLPITLLLPLLIPKSTSSNSEPSYVYSTCDNSSSNTFPANSQYETNLNMLLSYLSGNAQSNPDGFSNKSFGSGTDAVYGLYFCREDINVSSCSNCVTAATTVGLPTVYCPYRKEALIGYDQCMVRYSNLNFFGQMDTSNTVTLMATKNITGNLTMFNQVLAQVLNNVTDRAADGKENRKFAVSVNENVTKSGQRMYTFGQCTPDLAAVDCRKCLRSLAPRMMNADKQGVHCIATSCALRYELYPFFDVNMQTKPAARYAADPDFGDLTL